jgi:ubiquitin carboxyl-terminal hydrolase 44/49
MYSSQETKLSPDNFLTFMRKKLTCFSGYQQQDAQEFLRALLDQMHEELKSKKGKTLILQIFQGQFISEMTCGKCKNVSRKEEPFLDLSLSIPQTQTVIPLVNSEHNRNNC